MKEGKSQARITGQASRKNSPDH